MKPYAARASRIMGMGAFGVWEKAMKLERQGRSIIHLELGEPDFETPAHIVAAAHHGMLTGRTLYGSSAGEWTLREAIAGYLQRSRDIDVIPERIMVTPGVKGALSYTMLSLIEAGDEVLLPTPGYPPYKELVAFANGKSVFYELKQSDGYQIDSAEILSKITPRTKAIIINTPSNPTGTLLNRESLEKVATIAKQHDLWVIADEVYFQIVYAADRPISIYELPDMAERTILMDGFSKTYAMTGWRLGYAVIPLDLADKFSKMMVSVHSSLPPFIQDAGAAALNSSQDCVAEMVAAYRRRRDLTYAALSTMPNIETVYPNGAFYILMDIRQTGRDSETLAYQILDQGVALLPQGDDYLRIAFTQSEVDMARALEIVQRQLV